MSKILLQMELIVVDDCYSEVGGMMEEKEEVEGSRAFVNSWSMTFPLSDTRKSKSGQLPGEYSPVTTPVTDPTFPFLFTDIRHISHPGSIFCVVPYLIPTSSLCKRAKFLAQSIMRSVTTSSVDSAATRFS